MDVFRMLNILMVVAISAVVLQDSSGLLLAVEMLYKTIMMLSRGHLAASPHTLGDNTLFCGHYGVWANGKIHVFTYF